MLSMMSKNWVNLVVMIMLLRGCVVMIVVMVMLLGVVSS